MKSSRLLFLMCRRTLSLIMVFSAVNLLFPVLGCQAEEKNKEGFLMSRNLSDGLYASLDTDQGEIVVELFYEKTPITVANFVSLVEGSAGQSKKKGPFYDGLKFHRVVADFMIQGGDPLGNGTGGPGYLFQDEIVEGLTFDKPGYLAMANSGPGTNGSQFFITLSSTPHLNGKHTIFGRVVADGDQAIVSGIKEGDIIKRVKIGRQGEKAKGFDADREKQIQSKVEQKMSVLHSGAWENRDGIFYVMKEKGSGDKPKSGDTVNIHYKGYFLDNEKVFDSSYERGGPLTFNVGMKQVIAGWDKTVLDMQVQEKRLIVLSPELAYGDKGAGGVIPPHSWLVFEMERIS